MELVWWALYFKRHFISKSIFLLEFLWLFVYVYWKNTQEKWLLKCFSHGLELKTKKLKSQYRIAILVESKFLKKSQYISYPKYHDSIESGGRCIVPSLVNTHPAVGSHLFCGTQGAVRVSVPCSRAPHRIIEGGESDVHSPHPHLQFLPTRTRNLWITSPTL